MQEQMYSQLTENGKALVDKKKVDLENGGKGLRFAGWFFVVGAICEILTVVGIPFLLFTIPAFWAMFSMGSKANLDKQLEAYTEKVFTQELKLKGNE